MITMTELNALWKVITPQYGNSIGRRAEPSHPLDFFVSYDEQNNMQLMLFSDQRPDLPASSQQILVRGNMRSDGKYALCFSLANSALRDLFIALCWDIMDCTYKTTNRSAGVVAAVDRFRMWQMLFAEMKKKRMSDEEAKGLLGELHVLSSLCIPLFGLDAAVSGWVGPLKADRDFEYASTWIETKCGSRGSETISISSFDQLDTDALGELTLCRVEKAPDDMPMAISINKLVKQLKQSMSGNEYVASVFSNRLFLYGYNEEDERSDQPYMFYGLERYRVDDQFPRIRRSLLPAAICTGKYSVSIPEIQPWRAD